MTRSSVPATFSCSAFRRRAYSRPACGSWIEHGPTTTNMRGSLRSRMSHSAVLPFITTSAALSDSGRRACRSAGVGIGSNDVTLTFSRRLGFILPPTCHLLLHVLMPGHDRLHFLHAAR